MSRATILDVEACAEAELPEFAGGSVVVMNRLIGVVDVDGRGAVVVQRRGEAVDELGETRLGW